MLTTGTTLFYHKKEIPSDIHVYKNYIILMKYNAQIHGHVEYLDLKKYLQYILTIIIII